MSERRGGKGRGEGMPEGVGAIDCDVHAVVPSMAALAPNLDEFWRGQVAERVVTQLDGQSWPINAPRTPRSAGISGTWWLDRLGRVPSPRLPAPGLRRPGRRPAGHAPGGSPARRLRRQRAPGVGLLGTTARVVAAVDENPPGGRKPVEVAGRRVVVFNPGGEFFAPGAVARTRVAASA